MPAAPLPPRLRVDRASPVPLHVQLKQALRDQILGGAWAPGDLLPGENDLCQATGLSRTTVRQALSELTREGLLVRERGRGTFVAAPKLTERAAERLSGFFEDMVTLGYPPVSQVLKQHVIPASDSGGGPARAQARRRGRRDRAPAHGERRTGRADHDQPCPTGCARGWRPPI